MTPAGMAAIRIAATLAHSLPTVRVRVRHRGETLFDVVGHPAGANGPAIGACAFRRAVACAHEQSKRGIRVALMGVPVGEEPAVDIGVRAGDAALPGGVYRVTIGDSRATLLLAIALAAELIEDVFGLPVRVIPDPECGTPLVIPRARAVPHPIDTTTAVAGNGRRPSAALAER